MVKSSSTILFWLFIFFILLQLGDGLSTYILGIKTSMNGGIEANPIARYIFKTVGFLEGLILLKMMGILLGLFVYRAILIRARFYKLLFTMMILSYVVLNIHNWYLVYYGITTHY